VTVAKGPHGTHDRPSMKNLEPEDVWLRFFLRRLCLGLRNAQSPATAAVLKELIAVAEERLDRVEPADDKGASG
jgi:hypothetical protein